jgi:hypothetical protein
MMRWSDLPLRPPLPTLRRFGVIGLVILTALAGWQFYRERWTLGASLQAAGLVLGALALAYPRALRPVFVGMMIVGFPINWVVSHVMLAVIFYCVFTPLALLFRLIGRDVLARRFRPGQETYWTDKPAADGVRSYFRQS